MRLPFSRRPVPQFSLTAAVIIIFFGVAILALGATVWTSTWPVEEQHER
jgi:hypothetical protein